MFVMQLCQYIGLFFPLQIEVAVYCCDRPGVFALAIVGSNECNKHERVDPPY
jgi:hypothetical protein